jgi:hypothetical protein
MAFDEIGQWPRARAHIVTGHFMQTAEASNPQPRSCDRGAPDYRECRFLSSKRFGSAGTLREQETSEQEKDV